MNPLISNSIAPPAVVLRGRDRPFILARSPQAPLNIVGIGLGVFDGTGTVVLVGAWVAGLAVGGNGVGGTRVSVGGAGGRGVGVSCAELVLLLLLLLLLLFPLVLPLLLLELPPGVPAGGTTEVLAEGGAVVGLGSATVTKASLHSWSGAFMTSSAADTQSLIN